MEAEGERLSWARVKLNLSRVKLGWSRNDMTRSRREIRQRGKESGNSREGIRIGIFYLKY
jgi:hypothetical protein